MSLGKTMTRVTELWQNPVIIGRICTTTVVWVFLLPRLIPSLDLDRGIFVSVAERLIAGDRLYSDVWDNKDPLFYYVIALGRCVSPLMDVVVEWTYLLMACTGVAILIRRSGGTSTTAWTGGFIAGPVALTGGIYFAGYSHLPGVAVGLLCLGTASIRRPFTTGVLIGVVLGLKFIVFPVVAVSLATLIYIRAEQWNLRRFAAGLGLTIGVLGLVLSARGELVPYTSAQIRNVRYTQSTLLDARVPYPLAHLARVLTVDSAASFVTIIVVLVALRIAAPRKASSPPLALWWSALAAFGGAIAVIAGTGLWQQHSQVLLVPAALAVALGALKIETFTEGHRDTRRALGGFALLMLTASFLGGPQANGYIQSITAAPERLSALTRVSPEAKALLSTGRPASYARVGSNDDLGHAYGLRYWPLACPHFHQYWFDPADELAADAACVGHADLVLVAASAVHGDEHTRWNAYLSTVNRILESKYVRVSSGHVLIYRRRH